MLTNRPPIVVILGHVDHGKTTLLDALRKSNVAAREAGGITQHIRSFQTDNITFIDTPGHEAFSAMRMRGSKLADIAILVISAVDGVMPQTKESIQVLKETQTSFIVAITKIDVTGANPDKIKSQLSENEVIVEDFGGQVPSVSISAPTGVGLPQLLELITLMAKLNPPQADPDAIVRATVLESRLDSRRGALAVVVVTDGTLQLGTSLFQTAAIGKVKALIDSNGTNITSALPGTPVEILGLTIVPDVGTEISSQPLSQTSTPKTDPPHPTAPLLKLILRTDVTGSLEAITSSLPAGIQLILADTGDITQSDILLAKTTGAKVMAFNTKIASVVQKLADTEQVPLRHYRIIYELLDDIHDLLKPPPPEIITGKAQIVAQFSIGTDQVAGCKRLSGEFTKSDKLKLVRHDEQLFTTRFKSLKIGKIDTDEIKSSQEFGAVFRPQVAFQIGDAIIACSTDHG